MAFLGFAPYPWAARLDRHPGGGRARGTRGEGADLVVVAIHAGAEGSAATHVPHGTEFFLGENRGNSRAFAHAVDQRRRRPRGRLGPARAARRRDLPRAPDRLLARQLRRVQELRARRHAQPERHLPRRAASRRELGIRAADPRSLHGAGLPALDSSDASVRLVAQLSREDFGATRRTSRPTARWRSDGGLVGSCVMSTPPTPPPRPPERPGGPPLRRERRGRRASARITSRGRSSLSPDGRGAPPPPKPPMLPRYARRIWPFLLVLLALNYWVASTIPDKKARVEIPYTVVQERGARGQRHLDHVQGHGDPGRWPASRSRTRPARTGAPARASRPSSRRSPTAASRRCWRTRASSSTRSRSTAVARRSHRSCSGSARRSCSCSCSCSSCAARGGGPAAAAASAGSGAHAPSATRPTASGSRSTTSPASTRPRTSSTRSSTSSRTPTSTGGSAGASRAACC